MPLLLLALGALLLIVAVRNTQAGLASALADDVPGFLKWAAAIVALGALGFVPGLEKPSRYLLALVFLVIVLKNYQQIVGSIGKSNQPVAASTPEATPATQYVAAISATPSQSSGGNSVASTAASAAGLHLASAAFDPASIVSDVLAGAFL